MERSETNGNPSLNRIQRVLCFADRVRGCPGFLGKPKNLCLLPSKTGAIRSKDDPCFLFHQKMIDTVRDTCDDLILIILRTICVDTDKRVCICVICDSGLFRVADRWVGDSSVCASVLHAQRHHAITANIAAAFPHGNLPLSWQLDYQG